MAGSFTAGLFRQPTANAGSAGTAYLESMRNMGNALKGISDDIYKRQRNDELDSRRAAQQKFNNILALAGDARAKEQANRQQAEYEQKVKDRETTRLFNNVYNEADGARAAGSITEALAGNEVVDQMGYTPEELKALDGVTADGDTLRKVLKNKQITSGGAVTDKMIDSIMKKTAMQNKLSEYANSEAGAGEKMTELQRAQYALDEVKHKMGYIPDSVQAKYNTIKAADIAAKKAKQDAAMALLKDDRKAADDYILKALKNKQDVFNKEEIKNQGASKEGGKSWVASGKNVHLTDDWNKSEEEVKAKAIAKVAPALARIFGTNDADNMERLTNKAVNYAKGPDGNVKPDKLSWLLDSMVTKEDMFQGLRGNEKTWDSKLKLNSATYDGLVQKKIKAKSKSPVELTDLLSGRYEKLANGTLKSLANDKAGLKKLQKDPHELQVEAVRNNLMKVLGIQPKKVVSQSTKKKVEKGKHVDTKKKIKEEKRKEEKRKQKLIDAFNKENAGPSYVRNENLIPPRFDNLGRFRDKSVVDNSKRTKDGVVTNFIDRLRSKHEDLPVITRRTGIMGIRG